MFQQQLYNLFSLLCLFFVTIICLMVNHQFSDDVNGVDHHILLPGFHICYVNCFKLLQRSIHNFDMNWKIGYRQFQHGTILNSIENVYETFQKFRRKLVVIHLGINVLWYDQTIFWTPVHWNGKGIFEVTPCKFYFHIFCESYVIIVPHVALQLFYLRIMWR